MPDLPLTLDRSAREPLSAQLVTLLREAVLDGTLTPGDKLPSTRTLALELGVSRGTVTTAFDQLSGEGYLESAVGDGTRVAAGVEGGRRTEATSVSRDIQADDKPGTIDARPGRPTPIVLDAAWKRAWRQALSESRESIEIDSTGEPRFRQSIADHVRRFRGLPCDPRDVIVTSGSSDAFLLLALTLGTGATIALENPGYPRARTVFARAGVSAVAVDSSNGRLDVAALAALSPAPSAALVTPSHHYPLGGALSVPDRIALLDWARRANAVIIEDDYDSEFRHVTRPLPAIASLDSDGRVALVGSFSKVLSTRLRCGYIIARGELGERLRATRDDLDSPVSSVQQLALAHYLDSGALARTIARARRVYSHRRSLILTSLGSVPGLSLSALDGGLHVVIESRVQDLAIKLADRGILVEPLERYAWSGSSSRDGIVLGYGASSDLDLGRALAVIRDLHE